MARLSCAGSRSGAKLLPSMQDRQWSTIRSSLFMLDASRRLLYTVNMARKLTAVRLKEEHLEMLTKEAKKQDVPVSHLIRVAVTEYLEKLREDKKKK